MRKIIGYVKEKNNWMFLLVSSIVALLTSLIISLTVYELQTLFEASKKQSEYLEKINADIKEYFLKKAELKNKVLMSRIEKYREYQDAVYEVYYDSNVSSTNIHNVYRKYNKKVKRERGFISTNHIEDFSTVMANNDLIFIQDNLKINIAFLELYSNKSLKNYENKIFKSLELIDTLYKNMLDDIEASIFRMCDYSYIVLNVNSKEKLLVLLNNLPFPKSTIKSIKSVQRENEKIAKEFSYLTREVLEDINVKLNGDKIDLISIIVQDKAKSFLKD